MSSRLIDQTPQGSTDSPSNEPAGKHGFLKTARQIAEAIGTEFFTLLASELRESLDAECVYIAEFAGGKNERVRMLASSSRSNQAVASDFPLAGTPDAEVAIGNPCLFTTGVREMFPTDRLLSDLQIESFVGVSLNDPDGRSCGIIAALYREPLDLEIYSVQSMLNAFTHRASAELNRKQTDDALSESEQRYRAYVQLNPDACWRIEFDEPVDTTLPEKEQLEKILRFGYIAECNGALVRKLGLKECAQLVGATIPEAVPDMQNVDRCLYALIRAGYRHNTVEVTRVGRRGKRSHFVTSHWGIVEDCRLQRIWGCSRDVTELRQIEAQFRHAQKFESMGTLAAGVAHDFKNLLTVILGCSAHLREHINSDAGASADITAIQKSVDQGTTLANQLLAFSRKPGGEIQLLDLNSVVKEDEQVLHRLTGPKIKLIMELERSPALVRADAGYIRQALYNLAVNARDAMPNGGQLTIAVSNEELNEDRPPWLAALAPGPYVRLSVEDNGVGMTPEVEEHAFEPFFTTKPDKGTGLGLSTVYGIVRQSGGDIHLETEPDNGTTVEIFLPRQSEPGESR